MKPLSWDKQQNGAPYIFMVTNFLAPALECEGRMLGTIIARTDDP